MTGSPLDTRTLLRREAVAGAIQCAGDSSLLRDAVVSQASDPVEGLLTLLHGRGWLPEPDDQALFTELLEEVQRQTADGTLVPSTVLEQLRTSDRLQGAAGLLRSLGRIGEILRGDSEMSRFRSGGQSAVKAMLLFLLRPEPDQVISWAEEETGADEVVVSLSRLLAGFASGFGGLPEEMRQAAEGADELLDWVAEGLKPNGFKWPQLEIDAAEPDNEQSEELEVSLLQELRDEVASGSIDRALHVAHTMGWSDCLVLSVVADGVDVRSHGRRVRATFPVGVKVEWDLEADVFSARLDGADASIIASALEGKRRRRRSPRARAKK